MLVKQLHLTYCYVYGFHRIWRILSVYIYMNCGLKEGLLPSKCGSLLLSVLLKQEWVFFFNLIASCNAHD